jgi:hypothetical protein
MYHLLYYYHTMVYSYATLERIPRYGHGNLGGGRGIFQSGLTLMTKMGHFPHPPDSNTLAVIDGCTGSRETSILEGEALYAKIASVNGGVS